MPESAVQLIQNRIDGLLAEINALMAEKAALREQLAPLINKQYQINKKLFELHRRLRPYRKRQTFAAKLAKVKAMQKRRDEGASHKTIALEFSIKVSRVRDLLRWLRDHKEYESRHAERLQSAPVQ